MLEKIRESLNLWRDEVDKLESDLEKKLQRLTYLEEAPLPAEDMADIVIESMSIIAEKQFHKHLEIKLARLLRQPMRDYSAGAWWSMLSGHSLSASLVEAPNLFWVLRDPISKAIREAIINWPDMPEAGPPRAERVGEIKRLESQIGKLRDKINNERQSAEAAGVDVAQIHNREPLRKRPGKHI